MDGGNSSAVLITSDENVINTFFGRIGTFALEEFTKVNDSHKREKTRTHSFMVKCNHCGKEMVNTSTKYHLKTQHREIFETVQAEFEENVLKKQVINHGAKNREDSYFNCQKCVYATNFQRRFDRHLFDEHLETSCQTCGSVFSNFEEYRKHLLSHVDPINCDNNYLSNILHSILRTCY